MYNAVSCYLMMLVNFKFLMSSTVARPIRFDV